MSPKEGDQWSVRGDAPSWTWPCGWRLLRLALLNRLVHQATPYELLAGCNLYDHPGRMAALVAYVQGAG
jgi:hypothetical protein